jgi:hypothetical protein
MNNDDLSPASFRQNQQFNSTGGGTGGGRTGVSEGYTPRDPNYVIPAQRIEQGLFTKPKDVSISAIVDSSGRPRPFYNLSTEPGEILGGLNEVTRTKVVNTLYSRGWYGGRKKEGGFGDNDRQAMEDLLYYSNVKGVDWETMINTVARAPISEGSGRAARVSSKEDLVEIANRTALSTIGRKLTETEAQQFASSYQGVQRAAGSSTEDAASPNVFFQNRIQQKYGAESEGYKYLTAISRVARLIEGM